MMKVVAVHSFGGPEQLRFGEAEIPVPKAGEVRVRLTYAGINFIDVYMRGGVYARSDTYRTSLPMVVGMEGAGHVDEVGAEVSEFKKGDRVGYCIVRGSYAQFSVVPAWRLVKIPDHVDLTVATALMLQGSTAHYLSHSAFPLRHGHTCLVHAGAGGVGQLLIQLAKLRGAAVLATVGSPDKAEIAKARGADHAILYRESEFRDEVMRITDGIGVDVIYDSVGRETVHRSIRSLRRRGLCVMFGASSGQVEGIAPLELAEAGSVFFTRPHLADYMASTAEIRNRARDLFEAFQAGKLHVPIDRVLPLSQASEAHRIIESRGTRGKLLLEMPPA